MRDQDLLEEREERKEEVKEVRKDEVAKEIIYNTRQLEFVIKDLAIINKDWDEKVKGHAIKLSNEIQNLQNESFVLNKLPEKVYKQIDELVPKISAEVQNNLFNGFESNLQKCSQELAKLHNRMENITRRLEQSQQDNRLNNVLSIIATIVIVLIITVGVSYLIHEKFPSKVWVDVKGEVHVEGGEVNIHKTPDLPVYDKSKKK